MKMHDRVLTVLLPTYNESESLPILVEMLRKTAGEVRNEFDIRLNVLVIDDGSPDGTYEVAEELAELYDDFVYMIQRYEKLGLGSAYKEGLKYVKNFLKSDFVVIMDCDLSHHPKYIVDFLRVQEERGSDIVVGSRYYNKKINNKLVYGSVHGWSFRRKLTSFAANFLTKTLFRIETSDVTGSFRLYKTEVLVKLVEQMWSDGFSFQVETIVMAKLSKCKIDEVPILFYNRVFGESKLGVKEIFLFLKTLFRLLCMQPVSETFFNLLTV